MFDRQHTVTQDITNKQTFIHAWDTGDLHVVCISSVQQMGCLTYLSQTV